MKKRVRKETFCVRIQPDILAMVQEVAVARGLSASVVLEKCLLNEFTLVDFKYLDRTFQINNTLQEMLDSDDSKQERISNGQNA
jgi:hypothetical protein